MCKCSDSCEPDINVALAAQTSGGMGLLAPNWVDYCVMAVIWIGFGLVVWFA